MKELKVAYSTYKEINGKVPLYHIKQGNNSYIACGVSENYLIICRILSSEDISDFEENIFTDSIAVASLDDAILLGTLSNKTPLIDPYQTDGANLVSLVGREGSETIWATHNFCDKTTWYGDSLRATDETLSDSGDNLIFSGSHLNWIDLVNGKLFDEDSVATDIEHGYSVSVAVDGVIKTPKPAFATTGGDYSINYHSGTITFNSPVTGSVVASYSYENGSTWYFIPETDKAIDIEEAEVQFTTDVCLNDSIKFQVFGNVEVFAPQYCTINGGPYPPGTKIPLETTKYKSMHQITDEAKGAYPLVPAISGTNGRGLNHTMYGFPFTYATVRRLHSKYGMELRVSLESDIVYGGERATATFYCVSRKESTLK